MSPKLKSFLERWVITTVAVLIAAAIVNGIHCESGHWPSLVAATLVLGLLNAFIRPFLYLISLPLVVATLGLFMLVINGGLLYLVGHLIKGFHVDTYGAAFWGGLIISVVSFLLHLITGTGKVQIQVKKKTSRRSDGSDLGNGPTIDV